MDRLELERDWLYNNSLTAFVGALLMLLARNIPGQDIDKDAMLPWIQWTYPITDWGSHCLSFLHLPLSVILSVIAFVLFAAALWWKPLTWAIRLSKGFSPFASIIVPTGVFLGWVPLVVELFATEPHLGTIVFYVGFVFLVLIALRPWIVTFLSR